MGSGVMVGDLCDDGIVRIGFSYSLMDGWGSLVIGAMCCAECLEVARTGSVGVGGILKNAITPGVWTVRDKSIDTNELPMQWEMGKGWKVRLYSPDGVWTHYLIHPDGSALGVGGRGNGTGGCIGIQGNGLLFRSVVDSVLNNQSVVEVHIEAA